VYVTWQLATPDVPVPDKVQLLELNIPVELLVKLTPPEGVTTVPRELSVTVAVQASSNPRPVGTQFTLVPVERWPTEIVELPLLPE
jgi:hypothetical protein